MCTECTLFSYCILNLLDSTKAIQYFVTEPEMFSGFFSLSIVAIAYFTLWIDIRTLHLNSENKIEVNKTMKNAQIGIALFQSQCFFLFIFQMKVWCTEQISFDNWDFNLLMKNWCISNKIWENVELYSSCALSIKSVSNTMDRVCNETISQWKFPIWDKRNKRSLRRKEDKHIITKLDPLDVQCWHTHTKKIAKIDRYSYKYVWTFAWWSINFQIEH